MPDGIDSSYSAYEGGVQEIGGNEAMGGGFLKHPNPVGVGPKAMCYSEPGWALSCG